MVRMSDIFKKINKKQEENTSPESAQPPIMPQGASREVPQEEVLSLPPAHPSEEVKDSREREPSSVEAKKEKEKTKQASEVRISSLVMKETTKPASRQETLSLYLEGLNLINELLNFNIDYRLVDTKKIISLTERLINQVLSGNNELIALACNGEIENKKFCYLPYHSVNTSILSAIMGVSLGYERPKLTYLTVAALLHDLGMRDYLDLANQSRRLNDKEYVQIRKHPVISKDILSKIDKEFSQISIEAAYAHHERLDGSGYPSGINKEAINEFAKILGIADVYEALIHPRSYRSEYSSLEAIRILISHKNSFEYKALKSLINNIGVFSLGNFVELNTKEIAQVIKINRGFPLSPQVKIIYDGNKEELKETRIVDLAAEPAIYIKNIFNKDELFKGVSSE